MRGWWGMHCWNGLSDEQQEQLIVHGYLPIDDKEPRNTERCNRGATVEITTMNDRAPGPRFYCAPCGAAHLSKMP